MRNGRFPVVALLGSLLLLAASLHPATAYSAAGDPPSGSPAGAVYQLPLQQGRSDAAPKGGGSSGGGSGGDSGSLYRTENNFGSSSRVPGLAAGAAGAAGALAGGGGSGGDGAGAHGGAGSGGDADGSGAGAGGQDEGVPLRASAAADEGNTSVAAGFVLVAAIGLLAAGAGALSRRSP